MQYWSLYFFAKFALYFNHAIKFNWFLNLLLAVFVTFSFRQPRWRIAQLIIAVIAATCLFYVEAGMPPPQRLLAEANKVSSYSLAYLMELLARFINLWYVLVFAVMVALYMMLAERLRFTSVVFVGILSIPLLAQFGLPHQNLHIIANDNSAHDPDVVLNTFYATERKRHLQFPALSTDPFDIIILHVGALSWDDLVFVDAPYPKLLRQFDIVFRNFNTATSHTAPAAKRLLRGSCGQLSDSELADAAGDGCSLLGNLQQAGYEIATVTNHNGHYSQFAQTVAEYGAAGTRLQAGKWGKLAMHGFDGTPVYGDYSVLSHWWNKKQAHASAKPVALYYHTITLHDGNKLDSMRAVNSVQSYKPRLDILFADIERFIQQLEHAGKPVVLILMPAHGAALRGDKLQASGMREIPSPKLTRVPVAIKLIGLKADKDAHVPVESVQPASYFTVFSLLADLMASSPYAAAGKPLAERLQQLPATEFVSENEKIIVMRRGDGYIMRSAEDLWIQYDSN